MTTDARPANRVTRLRASPLELRLYVAALLAVVYTISWRAIGGQGSSTEPAMTAGPTTSEPLRFVWIDSLPPSTRPTIALPAGWQRASDAPATVSQPARIIRVPSRRVHRVRTRSS